MYFLGLDLSLADSGIVLINEKREIVELNNIVTERLKNSDDYFSSRFFRLNEVLKKFDKIIYKYDNIAFTAVETYALQGKGRIVQLIEEGTLIRDRLFKKYRSPIVEISPMTLKSYILEKQSTKGKNTKAMIIKEIFKKFNIDINNDNIADAFVLANIALSWYQMYNGLDCDITEHQKKIIQNNMKKQDNPEMWTRLLNNYK